MLETGMIVHELLQRPVWQASELGQPIPASTHAVSVALPRWQDVVGYEEKRPEVMDRLAGGYPRFVVHPLVQELGRHISQDGFCLPFPSRRVARLAAEFVGRAGGPPAKVVARQDVFGVLTNGDGVAALRSFWQHTGLIVSSRQAEALLAERRCGADGEIARAFLRRQLASF